MLGIYSLFFSPLISSPGRFFAVNEIKLMMAFAILRFDIKTKDGRRPPEFKFNWFTIPDIKAEVLLRRKGVQPVASELENAV